MNASFSFSAHLIYSPEKELQVLAKLATEGKQVDWKPAIILAATYLEKYGVERLRKLFKGKKVELSGKFEAFSLSDVSILLYGLNLIDSKTYTHMNQIWGERIKIVHSKGKTPKGDYLGDEANTKYAPMLKNALQIIRILNGQKVLNHE